MEKYICPICNSENCKIESVKFEEINGPLEIMEGFISHRFICPDCGFKAFSENFDDLMEDIEEIRLQPTNENPAWKLLSRELEKVLGHKPSIQDVFHFIKVSENLLKSYK